MQYSENNSALIFKAAKAEEEQYCHMMIMSVASVTSTVAKEEKKQWASEKWTFIKQ